MRDHHIKDNFNTTLLLPRRVEMCEFLLLRVRCPSVGGLLKIVTQQRLRKEDRTEADTGESQGNWITLQAKLVRAARREDGWSLETL